MRFLSAARSAVALVREAGRQFAGIVAVLTALVREAWRAVRPILVEVVLRTAMGLFEDALNNQPERS